MPRLETPDQIRRAEARDRALLRRARREREEIAAERDRFELARDEIVFGFELALAAVAVVAAVALLVIDPDLFALVLLGGGGLGCIATFGRRRRAGAG